MATRHWTGSAIAVADVWTATIGGTLEVGDLFLVTIGAKTWSYAGTSTTIATVQAAMVAAFNALDQDIYPEFAEVTAAAGGAGEVVFTADEEGVPITLSVSTTESNGGAADNQTFTAAHTTTATGPEYWDNAANWLEASVPTTGDDVIIEDSDKSIRYGLAQTGVTLATMKIAANYRGQIGLPRNNALGYAEYRATFLAIKSTLADIGIGAGGRGSSMIKWDSSTAQTAVTVWATGGASSDGTPAFVWKGTHADNAMSCYSGSIGIGFYTGEAATLKLQKVATDPNLGAPTITYGDTVTANGSGAILTQSGGVIRSRSSFATVTKTGGELILEGAAAATTITNQEGMVRHESTGTITTLDCPGEYRRERNLAAATVTTGTFYENSGLWDGNGVVVWTNPVNFYRCSLGDMKYCNFGPHKKLTVAAI